jgi:hypothetical protein
MREAPTVVVRHDTSMGFLLLSQPLTSHQSLLTSPTALEGFLPCTPTFGIDLHDPFQTGVCDVFQRRAPGQRHGQVKFRQNILDHLANALFPGNGQTVDVGTSETDR